MYIGLDDLNSGCECGSNTITNKIMSMKLQLQVGKRYVLHCGWVTESLGMQGSGLFTAKAGRKDHVRDAFSWREDGKCITTVSTFDIVSEYTELHKLQEGFEDLTEADHKAIDDYAAQGAEIDPYKVMLNGVLLDPYRIAVLYKLNDPIVFQILKKALRFGRKHKSQVKDVTECITSGIRWLEIHSPADAEQFKKGGAL